MFASFIRPRHSVAAPLNRLEVTPLFLRTLYNTNCAWIDAFSSSSSLHDLLTLSHLSHLRGPLHTKRVPNILCLILPFGLLWITMTENENRSVDSLNLSWPDSVNYHVDTATCNASSLGNSPGAKPPETGSREPVTTYNGVPREHIRNSQPLFGDDIRVLDLKNGIAGTLLVGSLRRVRLSDKLSNKEIPVYEPLSYTWQDDNTVQPCDDTIADGVPPLLFLSDSGHFLELTSNLARALCSVRKPETERTIWVDSICVNQDDTAERSRQVDRMKDIYAKAFTVLVYLGRESTQGDSSSSTAMALLRQPHRLGGVYHRNQREKTQGESSSSKVKSLFRQPYRLRDLHHLNQRERTSLKLLFGRRYFQRTWIVQEVALAKTLEFYCGPDISHVSEVVGKPLDAIFGCRISPPWLRHSRQTMEELSNDSTKSQAEQILSLLFDTAQCNCKDDRDRIFALFSLPKVSDKERLKTDYSLSTPQVYTGISAYLATNGFLWSVLILAPRFALDKFSGIPSWVPDWASLGKVTNSLPLRLSYRLSRIHDLDFELASSGTLTIPGRFLGTVANLEYSRDQRGGNMDHNEYPAYPPSDKKQDSDESGPWNGRKSHWTLTRPTQKKSLDSWKCYFQFETQCMRPDNVDHRAFMLPDYSTVLILKSNSRDQYDLVESGQPLFQISLPEDWKEGLPRQSLQKSLKPMTGWKESHLDTFLSSKEAFPGLSQFPELWGLNPFTMTLTLTHKAIRKVRSVRLTELDLLQRWQRHARTCLHVLRDKTRLRLLIDKVKGLCHQDYRQMEAATGLGQHWSLDHFLGLFIRDPYKGQPMVWPDVQLHGATPVEEMDILPQLMLWARVTRQFLALVSQGRRPDFPELPMDYAVDFWAKLVAKFQVSTASVNAKADDSGRPGRTWILLERILCQIPDGSNLEVEQVEGPIYRNERYWDWERFNRVMGQRFCTLGIIQADVEKIQANLHDFKPDFGALIGHQVFAAHGVDLSKSDFTQIRIR